MQEDGAKKENTGDREQGAADMKYRRRAGATTGTQCEQNKNNVKKDEPDRDRARDTAKIRE